MVYRYEHTPSEPLTVGGLLLLLAGLDDSTQIELVVPTGPSTECGIGDEPPLILTGGSGDWTVVEETGRPVLTLSADYPAGHYVRLDDGRHVPDRSR
ncbi:hypothetical protein ACFWSF_32275 [Streptomyces sp. NPDC058611]|uniref:hypothetical protein n=1 Tax=unclassified Streptomyces TaxID=2593676 RepID=UPI00365CD7E4